MSDFPVVRNTSVCRPDSRRVFWSHLIGTRGRTLLALAVIGASSVAVAGDSTVVVERGDAKLTLDDLDGRMSRFPPHERASYARDPENLARLMDQLLVNRALAEEARQLGLDRNENVAKDLALAVEEVLAVHRLNLLVSPESLPDFEQLAHEMYLSDPSVRQAPESRAVQHILVSTAERSEAEALALAQDLRARAVDGADFSALVGEFSEDPGKASNGGHYVMSVSGEFAPQFEAGAKALANVGDISEPILTDFGYHIILLRSYTPAKDRPFDEVKGGLVTRLRNDFVKEARGRHVSTLRNVPETGDTELLRTLPARYGGRPELPLSESTD
jgi:parvulin-like peptidyl-prolyl isomerase